MASRDKRVAATGQRADHQVILAPQRSICTPPVQPPDPCNSQRVCEFRLAILAFVVDDEALLRRELVLLARDLDVDVVLCHPFFFCFFGFFLF